MSFVLHNTKILHKNPLNLSKGPFIQRNNLQFKNVARLNGSKLNRPIQLRQNNFTNIHIRFYSKEVPNNAVNSTENIPGNSSEINDLTSPESFELINQGVVNESFARLTDFAYYNTPFDPILYAVQSAIEGIQILTGLPWWATIAVFSVTTRLILTPLQIKQLRNNAILQSIMPEINEIRKKSTQHDKMNRALGKTPSKTSTVMSMTEKVNELYKKKGISPFSMIYLTMPQAIYVLVCFISLNRFTSDTSMVTTYNGLQNGGFLWFRDLTVQDPFLIFPLASMATTILFFLSTRQQQQWTKTNTLILIFGSAFTLFIASKFSCAVHIYLISANIVSILTNYLLRTSYFSKKFNIPITNPMYAEKPKLLDHRPKKK